MNAPRPPGVTNNSARRRAGKPERTPIAPFAAHWHPTGKVHGRRIDNTRATQPPIIRRRALNRRRNLLARASRVGNR